MFRKLFYVVALSCALAFNARARINDYKYLETYLQFVPAAFMLGAGCVGVKCEHNLTDRLINTSVSFLAQTAITYPLKWTIRELRPDGSAYNSFPSGHTAAAFTGAELIRQEYGWGWGSVFYANAIAVAALRAVHRRHWWWDTIAGAGIGIFSAWIGRWTTDRIQMSLAPDGFSLIYKF